MYSGGSGVCSLPKETGPCRAYSEQFYFDNELGACLSFVYGGCRGNENRFPTVEECQQTCAGPS